jgi:orotate phosphoribosyltransferase
MLPEQQRLLEILNTLAIKRGNFTLASGATSDYYIDARMITSHPEGAYLIGKIIYHMIKDDHISAIGGPILGAVPVCNAVSLVSYLEGCPIPAFFVRNSVKKYGMQRFVEGNITPGSRVVIVDDVITSAGSALSSIEQVQKLKCQVAKVICVVDREAGGREKLAEKGYILQSIFTKTALGLD